MRIVTLFLAFAAVPVPALATFSLPDGQACVSVPFRLEDNRAMFEAMVNGQGPFQFAFDTGANSILDASIARHLGVALDEAGQTGGAGAGTQQTWRTRVDRITFAGVSGRDAEFMALDLSEIRKAIGFARLDGLMGREVLAQFLVRYDYDASALQICDPARAPASMRVGRAVPIEIGDWDMPAVAADLDGRPGRYIVDTGDRSSLTLFGPFVARHKLRGAYAPVVRAVTGRGVGGPIPADVVRAGSFSFGGFTLTGVTTRMPVLTSGGFASDDYAGSIGNGILRRFNVTFDYSAKRMYLEPRERLDVADRYDRSGMWLAGHPQGFEVLSVAEGGPAAQSGIAAGDIVTHVDGKSVADLSLIAVRDQLMDFAPGTRVTFTVRTKNETAAQRTAVLRDLLSSP